MNRYVLAGIALVCLGAQASENPFDLKQNLQNLDAEQSALLSELKKAATSDDFLDDEPVKEKLKESDNQTMVTPAAEENLTKTTVKADEKIEAVSTVSAEEKKTVSTEVKPPVEMPQKTEAISAVPVEENKTVSTEVKAAVDTPQKTEVKEETTTVAQSDSAVKEDASQKNDEADAMLQYEIQRLKQAEEDGMQKQQNRVETPAVMTSKKEASMPQQNDINLTKEVQMKEEDIERLYLEAIKEVEGK